MKTRNHSIALYEQKIKGLEVNMHGLMQVWHLHDDLGFRFAKERGVTWPNDYELVCGLDTDCLDEAFRMTNDQCHWEQEQITLVPPYGSWETLESGRTVFWMPRSTSVGDVLVTREGVLYVVNDFGFRRVGRL